MYVGRGKLEGLRIATARVSRVTRASRLAFTSLLAFALIGLAPHSAAASESVVDPLGTVRDFGDAPVGMPAPTNIMVTVRNVGVFAAESVAWRIKGANASDFAVVGPTPNLIPGGCLAGNTAPCEQTVSIRFTPSQPGDRFAFLEVDYQTPGDATDPGPFTLDVDLTGHGITPPKIAIDKVSPHDFGAHRVLPIAPPNLDITITNDGIGDLTVFDFTLDTSSDCDHFTLSFTKTPPFVIHAQTSEFEILTITFDPLNTGTFSCDVAISSDDPINSDEIFTVTGEAVEGLIALTPTALDIGDVVVGEAGTGSVSIDNAGGGSILVSSIALSGGNASEFAIDTAVPPPDITIGGGTSSNVTVRCTPTAPGTLSTSLEVISDADSIPSDPTAGVTCRGVKPDIQIDGSDPAVTAPGPISFGSIGIGSMSPATTVEVGNDSASTTSSLLVSNVSISGANAGDFSVEPNEPFSLAASGRQNLSVTFSPSGAGARTAVLTIESDDLETPSVTIDLAGTGGAPDIRLVQPATLAIDFGDTLVGQNSATRTIEVDNEGDQTLRISSVTIVGDAGFSVASGPAVPPAADIVTGGASLVWAVRCSPGTVGSKAATFRILSSDPDESPLDIALSCRAVQPQLSVVPAPVNFPDTRVGEAATPISVTVSNSGTADLTVTSVTLVGTDFSITSAPPGTPFTLSPGADTTVGLGFTPMSSSAAAGALRIDSDDPGGLRNVTVLGNGLATAMSLMPAAATFDFGDVCVGGSGAEQDFVVMNSAAGTFQVASVSLLNDSDFGLTFVAPASYPAALAATEQATIRLSVDPAAVGATSDTLSIVTDIPPTGVTTTVSVTANGIAAGIGVSPTAHDFGDIAVDADSPVQQITIRNCSPGTIVVNQVGLSGTDANEFALVSGTIPPPDITIPELGEAVWSVRLTPRTLGAKTASFVVQTASSGTINVALSGAGTSAASPDAGVDAGGDGADAGSDPDAAAGRDAGTGNAVDDDLTYYGCGCSTGRGTGTGGWFIALAMLLAIRRRRPAA